MTNREENSFLEHLRGGAVSLGLAIDPEAQKRLQIHYETLSRWSQRMNLTAVRGRQAAAEKLYLESALLASLLNEGGPVIDAGSGAGFPGLVIKALRPELEVVLVEAREKKAAFLSHVSRLMGLIQGLRVENKRLGWDDLSLRGREVVSRAAFPPEIWCELGSVLVSTGGRLWFFLNGRLQAASASITPPEGFSTDNTVNYRLPFCGQERTLLALRRGP